VICKYLQQNNLFIYLFIYASSFLALKMRYRVLCSTCQKFTWAGCGLHIEAAMKGVCEEDKCLCPRTTGVDRISRFVGGLTGMIWGANKPENQPKLPTENNEQKSNTTQ